MIVTALLVKNEAARYLGRVLTRCAEFSDKVLVLDDGSTDESVLLAQSLGAQTRVRSAPGMWGNETPARRELWEWAATEAGDGWVLVCDADQVLVGDPRPYTESWMVNTWSFPLYDAWNTEDTYRADGYWAGYKHPRPWFFRPSAVPEGWQPQWSGRGLHSGHAPSNWPMAEGIAFDLFWLHLGWLKPEDRLVKYQRYRDQWETLTPFEQAHVESIVE